MDVAIREHVIQTRPSAPVNELQPVQNECLPEGSVSTAGTATENEKSIQQAQQSSKDIQSKSSTRSCTKFVSKLDSIEFSNEKRFEVMQSVAEGLFVSFDAKELQLKLWPHRKQNMICLRKVRGSQQNYQCLYPPSRYTSRMLHMKNKRISLKDDCSLISHVV